MEVLSEPLYILASTRLLFGLRVGVETTAMTAKGLLTLALVRQHTPGSMPPALAFSWGQLAYAGITLGGYAAYFLPQLLRAVGRRRQAQARSEPAAGAGQGGQQADGEILRLSGTFTLQARCRCRELAVAQPGCRSIMLAGPAGTCHALLCLPEAAS